MAVARIGGGLIIVPSMRLSWLFVCICFLWLGVAIVCLGCGFGRCVYSCLWLFVSCGFFPTSYVRYVLLFWAVYFLCMLSLRFIFPSLGGMWGCSLVYCCVGWI